MSGNSVLHQHFSFRTISETYSLCISANSLDCASLSNHQNKTSRAAGDLPLTQYLLGGRETSQSTGSESVVE